MSSYQDTYVATSTNYPGCAYKSASNYQTSWKGAMQRDAAHFDAMKYQYVPDVNPVLSYDTLVKGANCSGYPTIVQAYGVGAENCCPGMNAVLACPPAPSCQPCCPVKAAVCTPFTPAQAPKCVDTAAGPVYV